MKKYSLNGRADNMSGIYCKIAMQSYFNAEQYYKKISDNDFDYDMIEDEYELYKSVMVTVIFSAMCLESFFNDYMGACLGDKNFKDNYDRLSPISKFHFISELIFKSKIDKSQSYYTGVKKLFTLRNSYVHNRSSHKEISEDIINAIYSTQDKSTDLIDTNFPCDDCVKLDKKCIEEKLDLALTSLKTVRDVARYFDKYDEKVFAMVRLFGEYNIQFSSKYEVECMKYVFNKLQISERFVNEI